MKITLIEASPNVLSHRVRGMGVYSRFLTNSLKRFYPENEYLLSSKPDNKANINHYLYFEPFFRTLPIIKKGKRVVTVHDLTPLIFPDYFPAGLKGKLKWQLQKLALKNSDVIITDSQSSRKDIVKLTGISDKKIRVVYLAASDNFRKLPEEKVNYVTSKFKLPDRFVLYVGDATWNKNLVRLINAIKKTKIPLVMAGSALVNNNFDKNNPWNKDLKEVQTLASGDTNIIRLGFVDDTDLVALYNKAVLLAMPSIYEGFGLPILEAMSCGTPCLTSDKGSIPEVSGNASFVVDPFDVSDLASGIKELFENESERKVLIDRGLKQAKKFSWEKTAEETLESYKNALE